MNFHTWPLSVCVCVCLCVVGADQIHAGVGVAEVQTGYMCDVLVST